VTLAWLAAKGRREPFGSATFMVSMQDFEKVGESALFMGESSIDFIEQQMLERGYLDSRHMANMFNLMRANDLIWSTVVNNYLMGNRPPAFDLLYWNSDGTRMAAAAHSFYLRNTYLENNLIKPGKVSLLGTPIDLSRSACQIYAIGAEKEHIVPWRAAWRIARLTRAKTRFVLAASGHIAGMINPPSKGKGGYWTNDADTAPETAEAWLAGAQRHEGSWWADWSEWLASRSGGKRPAPRLGSTEHPPLGDAPGTYVLET
jgi:polyhydroxyalkanoate synthase